MELDNLYGVQACSLTRMRIMLRQPSAKTGLFALGDWAWKARMVNFSSGSLQTSQFGALGGYGYGYDWYGMEYAWVW